VEPAESRQQGEAHAVLQLVNNGVMDSSAMVPDKDGQLLLNTALRLKEFLRLHIYWTTAQISTQPIT
jgi:hypothetical protein